MIPLTPDLLRAALPLLHHGETLCCWFRARDCAPVQCRLLGPGDILPTETVRLTLWYDPGMSGYSVPLSQVWIRESLQERLEEVRDGEKRALGETSRRQAVAVFVELARRTRATR